MSLSLVVLACVPPVALIQPVADSETSVDAMLEDAPLPQDVVDLPDTEATDVSARHGPDTGAPEDALVTDTADVQAVDDAGLPGASCLNELTARGVSFIASIEPVESPPSNAELSCTIADPIWLTPVFHGVTFRLELSDPPALLLTSCALALALDDVAALVALQGVTDIVHLGVYSCRVISGTDTLSQHAFANAIDIAGFQFDDATYWTVYDDWEDGVPSPVTEAGEWLLWFANEVYEQWLFNVIFTPEYGASKDDHLHCDLTPGAHFLR